MPMTLLKLEPDDELSFSKSSTTASQNRTLKVINNHTGHVAFKVKTTAPKAYLVRPSSGTLKPRQDQEVQIILVVPHDGQANTHRFLVQAVAVSNANTLSRDDWTKYGKEALQEHRLNVVLEDGEGEDKPGREAAAGHGISATESRAATGASEAPILGTVSPDEGSTYGDELLQPARLPQTVKRLRLLQALHEQDQLRLRTLCRAEGFRSIEAGGARAFVRRSRRGASSASSLDQATSPTAEGYDAEVYFQGSVMAVREETERFVDNWLMTNPNIRLKPLDPSLCRGLDPGPAHAHAGFQALYLTMAPTVRAAVCSQAGEQAADGDEWGHRRQGVGPAPTNIDGDAYAVGSSAATSSPRCRVSIIGHSLGGALACFSAIDFASLGLEVELITFGAPRVGNMALRNFVHQSFPGLVRQSARLVNTLDLVPHVPFSRQDAVDDGSAVGRLWNTIEGTLATMLPLERLVGDGGQYRHWFEPTLLDMLMVTLAGLITNVTTRVAAESGNGVSGRAATVGWASALGLMENHLLSAYLSNLMRTQQSVCGVLSSALLSATSEITLTSAIQAVGRSATLAISGCSPLGIPANLGVAAISAYGCYRIGQRLDRVASTVDRLDGRVIGLLQEVAATRRSLEAGLDRLASEFLRQPAEAIMIEVRAGCAQLTNEMELLAQPSADLSTQREAVRKWSSELRYSARKALEVAANWQRDDEDVHRGVEIAQLLRIVLNANHLDLLASARIEDSASGRAFQALRSIAEPIGRFVWRYSFSGDEAWGAELAMEGARFFGTASSVATRDNTGVQMLQALHVEGRRSSVLFAALAMTPNSAQVRAELALVLAMDGDGTPLGSPSPPLSAVPVPATRALLHRRARAILAEAQPPATAESPSNESLAGAPFGGSASESATAARELFFVGVVHAVPVDGRPPQWEIVVESWNEAANRGEDMREAIRSLNGTFSLPESSWAALAEVARTNKRFQLLSLLPEALQALGKALLSDLRFEVRRAAADALGKIGGPEAVNALIKTLQDSTTGQRQRGHWHLYRHGQMFDVRAAAARALGEAGGQQALQALGKALLLSDQSFEVRMAAADALGKIGGPEALAALTQHFRAHIKSGDYSYRCSAAAAAGAIGQIDPKSEIAAEAITALKAARRDADWDVQNVAENALKKLGA